MKYFCFIFILSAFVAEAQILPPYFDNFESGAPGWYDSTYSGSSWELGAPNFGQTAGAFSGSNSWDVSLDSAYKNNTSCSLYSPLFDFSTTSNAVLSFWSNYNTEEQWDATKLQYSTDSGLTWQTLSTNVLSPSINWINYDLFGNSGWWGTSNCWALSAVKLDSVYGFPSVQFRFQFTSDASIFHDGISIDDFSIYDPQSSDASIASIISPQKSVQQNNPIVTAQIANLGLNTLDSVPVGFTINGGIPTLSNYYGLLESIQADSFSLGSIIAPNGYYTVCFFTLLLGDTNPFNDTLCCEFYNVINSVNEFEDTPFIIFPNPSQNNVIQIRNINFTGILSIFIDDLLGNTVYSASHIKDNSIILNEKLAAGIYFVRISDGMKSYSKKLIVEH